MSNARYPSIFNENIIFNSLKNFNIKKCLTMLPMMLKKSEHTSASHILYLKRAFRHKTGKPVFSAYFANHAARASSEKAAICKNTTAIPLIIISMEFYGLAHHCRNKITGINSPVPILHSGHIEYCFHHSTVTSNSTFVLSPGFRSFMLNPTAGS